MNFSLPPESYIGEVIGEIPKSLERFMHRDKRMTRSMEAEQIKPLAGPGVSQCELLLMDMGVSNTQFGPLWILGMPWFREYYTTFDLGPGNKNHRNIYVSPADKNCYPTHCEDNGVMGNAPPRPMVLHGSRKFADEKPE